MLEINDALFEEKSPGHRLSSEERYAVKSRNRDILRIFSRNIYTLMEAWEIKSGKELAQLTKKPPATVNRILSCRTPNPGVMTLTDLAEFFGYSLYELISPSFRVEGTTVIVSSDENELKQIDPVYWIAKRRA